MRWRERKLHILLGEGLAALAKCEKDTENYTIDMGEWAVTENGKCAVCLAGATFPKCMHQEDGVSYPSIGLSENARRAAHALDNLRRGEVYIASIRLRVPDPETKNRTVEMYHLNRTQWWKDMRKLKAELKRRNE